MPGAELRSVAFGTTTIPFHLHRSPRRATVSIAIDPASGVVVTAPTGAPAPDVERVVRSRAPWILERLRRHRDVDTAPPQREFVSGETFRYLGRQHRLLLERGIDVGPVRLQRGRLVLHIPAVLRRSSETAFARSALLDWYQARARAVLPARVEAWAAKLDVAPSRVLVCEPQKRWGSTAADGTVRLNWRVVQAAPWLVDYVVAHELTHLLHPEHSPEFWGALGRIMPDYDARRGQLRMLGPTLIW